MTIERTNRKIMAMMILALYSALLPAAAQPASAFAEMIDTVKVLSAPELKGRAVGTPELDKAAAFIADRFAAVGLIPGGADGSWYQDWTDPDLKVRMRNVVGVLPGRNPLFAGQSVVIGAHYDHLGTGMPGASAEDRGKIHPGADDNASGVAVLLELASRLPLAADMERSVVFVAFTGEELGRKGSQYYVRNERRYPAAKTVGMINLDTVGRLGKNKLIVIGGGSAMEWPELLREAGKAAGVEMTLSGQDLDASDQKSFHEAGVPAVQFFAGPHLDYHRPTDTADKVDPRGLDKVAGAARAAVLLLANLPGPLAGTVSASSRPAPAPAAGRKATIGIVPDFTFNGTGVRVGGTLPGGPAETAGMREGDVIIRAGSTPIVVLKDLSDLLRMKQPGEKLPVRFLRGGKEMQATIDVRER
jgi:aminopeptidase N